MAGGVGRGGARGLIFCHGSLLGMSLTYGQTVASCYFVLALLVSNTSVIDKRFLFVKQGI